MISRIKSFLANLWQWILAHKWQTIVAIVVLGFIIFRVAASGNNTEQLQFVSPERRDLNKTLEVSGVIDAKEKARLRFIAGGKVVYLGAKEGEAVKKWQTIATIDQASLEKQLQKDLNLYLKERLDWEDQLDDIENRALDTTENRVVERNQLDLNNTVLDVEIRDVAINNTVLSAPFSGILTVSPATTTGVQLLSTDYFEIVNPETLVFRAEIDEADIGLVSVEQLATIILDSFPDLELEANISYISFTSSQSSSGTVFIVELPILQTGEMSLASGSTALRIGMNGEAIIQLASKENVMSIPIDATRIRDDKVYVDVKTGDNSSEEREIETGLETDEYIEVISGLAESEMVVLPE